MKRTLLFSFVFLFSTFSFAEPLKLNYPELMVTPRASERLKLESIKETSESGRWYKEHTPIQASALLSIFSGTLAKANVSDFDSNEWSSVSDYEKDKKEFKQGADLLLFNGLTWLGITTYMAYSYKPFSQGLSETNRLPSQSKRQQLTKERIAEEKLYDAYIVGQRMAWTYAVLNTLLAVNIMDFAGKGDNSELKTGLALTAASSFLPLFFRYRSYDVYQQHQIYKKKIYGPVASATLIPTRNALVPGIGITGTF
tara:strand:- start:418 stop:1182 length:765 start_codon:yes stop_codon:yes gene_type:complete